MFPSFGVPEPPAAGRSPLVLPRGMTFNRVCAPTERVDASDSFSEKGRPMMTSIPIEPQDPDVDPDGVPGDDPEVPTDPDQQEPEVVPSSE